jgi:integrase
VNASRSGVHYLWAIKLFPRGLRDDAPSRFIGEEHHVDLLRRCLTGNDSIPLDARVAGGLLLLYGVRIAQIHALTVDRLSRDDRGSYLTIDTSPVLLPPSLARLIDQLIAEPRRRFGLTVRSTAPPAYLFPGKPPTRPMTPTSLTTLFGRHGIPVAAARNTALITLAADPPAPVIADLFGLNRKTAATWSTYAQADWTAYLNARQTSS